MKMSYKEPNNGYKIDLRMKEDIWAQIARLASSYTPEWLFDADNPDIGSVIALIFAEQLEGSIERLNQLPEKYRIEFVNMLNIGLQSAYPAQGMVVMDLIRDTVPGVNVPCGTKLLGSGDDGSVMVFETTADIHVTNSRLSDLLAISPSRGKIIPILGEIEQPKFFPVEELPSDDFDSLLEDYADGIPAFPRFKMFDYKGEGVQQNALLMYHTDVFDTEDKVDLLIRIQGEDGGDLSHKLADEGRFRWSYYDGEDMSSFDAVTLENGAVVLRRDGTLGKIRMSSKPGESGEFSLVCVEAVGAVTESIGVKTLQIASTCEDAPPTFVSHNESELDSVEFMPFGEQISIFDECYIGHDRIFKQKGAKITLRFEMNYREKLVTFTPEQLDEQLKIIKRRPRQISFDTARTCAERIAFEYFNGTGFKKLELFSGDWSSLFNGKAYGEIEMSFICPDDWEPITIAGSSERAIRIRVSQADNCYLQPCLHNMPVLKNLLLSYSYEGDWKSPQRLRVISGTRETDLTRPLLMRETFTAFSPIPYDKDALYLGFERRLEGSPASLFFEVDESMGFSHPSIKFQYSTLKGFAPLKVYDNTNRLSNSGIVMFQVADDFARIEIEGKSRYWLRITDERMTFDENPGKNTPLVRRILTNAVQVHNVRTLEEESFYMEAVTANMSFPLPANNILSAEVYVNERNLSRESMQELQSLCPEKIRVEYDGLGRISDFFVKWEEVQNFDGSKAGERHYVLDRMSNSIQFGDGVNVKIPLVVGRVAFTATVKCCDGSAANLPAGAINSVMGNILYIDDVYNPIATYAGSDLETVSGAIERGANIINGKNRLVSEIDFMREALSFSGMIVQAKCVIGRDADGNRKNGAVSLAIMMGDYVGNSYSFEGVRERLKARLLEKSEATLTEEELYICQPVPVTLSVDVWIQPNNHLTGFEMGGLLIEQIKKFIEPVKSRRIGELPSIRQLNTALNSVRCDAMIRHFSVTAKYADSSGVHERELSELQITPFMFAVNGEHKVHV
ncbi:MAG: baseplate J/gp47 family protein [Oscillospiraceae bacterium]|nr:baseplate J/gp47 family protein [Oscillospiraceae bacterium]